MHQPIKRSAHAKINLGLSVLRRRADGYHDIETIFCPIALADEITFTPTEHAVTLDVVGSPLAPDPKNLCIRAARALQERANIHAGVHMVLRKNIPIGAGLGGGSSDAACVLLALNELWDLRWTSDQLREVASALGADVPYFLLGGLAFGWGKGDQLDPLHVRNPYWTVTIVPPVHVSTEWAYGALSVGPERQTSGLRKKFLDAVTDLARLESVLQNDFEAAVVPSHPPIAATMQKVRALGLSCVRMSGSGSSVFGLTADKECAFRAAGQFAPPFVVSITPPEWS